MGVGEKISNTVEESVGKAKETIGRVTGNEKLQAEGVFDQVTAKAKKAGESVKDFVQDVVEEVKKDAE